MSQLCTISHSIFIAADYIQGVTHQNYMISVNLLNDIFISILILCYYMMMQFSNFIWGERNIHVQTDIEFEERNQGIHTVKKYLVNNNGHQVLPNRRYFRRAKSIWSRTLWDSRTKTDPNLDLARKNCPKVDHTCPGV